MRIGIDARFAGPEGTGLGRYVSELVLNLQELDQENHYVIFLRRDNLESIQLKSKNFQKVLADIRWYSPKEQLVLPAIFCSQSLGLLHVPHFNIPVFYPGKFVVTIHDLIKSEFAGLSATTRTPFVYFLKHLGYEAVIQIAVRRAQKILVPSKSIAQKLEEILKVPQEKIIVTYEAASLSESGIGNPQSVLSKYKIKKPYILYVGNAYPYKNLNRLLLALRKLPKELSLVNPCSRSTFYERLREKTRELSLKDKVILPGFVPDDELRILYKEAEAYVFPSLSEGFGIPGLDAMALGVPVVCSDISTLKEIYGDAAVYFDPYSPEDIATKIQSILKDEALRNKLVAEGAKQVEKYSWQKMALETLWVYNSFSKQ